MRPIVETVEHRLGTPEIEGLAVLAEGDYDTVSKDERVVEAYIGVGHD
ncbi:MAG TPA: hypothetical protein VFJ13_08770 [Paracoccaceae bacterium]|nr:hypothetical protein [Paracoccaceae bacterium]